MTLNYKDIQAILKIIDTSPYNELKLENDEFSLYLKRDDNGEWSQEQNTLSPVNAIAVEKAQTARAENQSTLKFSQTKEPAATEEGLIDIRSPMVGTFYRSPQPAAEHFVSIGSKVEEDTVIAIIEVMKLMSSIPAKITGEVLEILVEDAQLVEKGQLLMRVRPSSP